MSKYTNFDELDTLYDSKIFRILMEDIDKSISNAYEELWSNTWFNRNENTIKNLYYERILAKNVINKIKKPTKVNDTISPGIKFEGD